MDLRLERWSEIARWKAPRSLHHTQGCLQLGVEPEHREEGQREAERPRTTERSVWKNWIMQGFAHGW